MNTPDQKGQQRNAGSIADPFDDVQPEWLYETSAHCEPIFFDTSAHIEAVFFDTSASVIDGNEGVNVNPADRGGAWPAYRQYGYSIWRFDGQDWQVVASKCEEGAVCGAPPREAGQFVGEHRKKQCEPAVTAAS
jgi:hypothetical protein